MPVLDSDFPTITNNMVIQTISFKLKAQYEIRGIVSLQLVFPEGYDLSNMYEEINGFSYDENEREVI